MSPPLSTSAHNYFLTTKAKDWSIRDYFTLNAPTLKGPDGFESLVRTWKSSLTSFANDSKSSSSQRQIAKRLLENYTKKMRVNMPPSIILLFLVWTRQGCLSLENRVISPVSGDDFREARMMRAILTNMPAAQPPIVVHGDNAFSNTTIVHGDNAFGNASVNGAPVVPLPTPTVPQTRQPTLKRKRKTPQNTSSPPPPRRFVQLFGDEFNSMPTDKKWFLPSGACVEDTLYECFKGDNEESAAHSWIIDIKDKNMKACFTPEDWQAICDAMPPPPAPDKKMVHSMCRYMGIKTADQLQDYLDNNSPFEPNEAIAITPDQRRGRRWADGVIRSWSNLLQDPTIFVRKHNENWYTCRFWTETIDKCLSTIEGSYMSRGETKSMCTSNRKNSQQSVAGKRRRVGHLYDGLLTINSHEVAVVEHGREFIGENGKKWGSDTLKVVKLLHDMLYELQSQVITPEVFRQLQVVGIVSAEWRSRMMRMAYAGGHICVLSTDEELKVPSNIAEFSALHTQLVDLWGYRELLNQCYREVINGSLLEPEQRMERMLMSPAQRGMRAKVIPRSVETDGGGAGGYDDTDDNDREVGESE